MFIVISFPTKTTKNAENLGVSFWKVAKKKISGQKVIPKDFSILILNPPGGFKRNIHRYTFQSSFPVIKIGTLVV